MHILSGFPMGASEIEVKDWNEKLASFNIKRGIKSSKKRYLSQRPRGTQRAEDGIWESGNLQGIGEGVRRGKGE